MATRSMLNMPVKDVGEHDGAVDGDLSAQLISKRVSDLWRAPGVRQDNAYATIKEANAVGRIRSDNSIRYHTR